MNEISKQQAAQRHVFPLYKKDERGGYQYSSTMTFVEFKNQHFLIFAAHALSKETDSLQKIGVIGINGQFTSLGENTLKYKICKERDLVVCQNIQPFKGKNYFNLDQNELSEQFSKNFRWIGFPSKNTLQTIDSSKILNDSIKKYIIINDDKSNEIKYSEYLSIEVAQSSVTEEHIIGMFSNKKVTYTDGSFKETGPSLKGMSGGALYRERMESDTDNPSTDDWFQFAGIGLEYHKKSGLVKGASRSSVLALLETM